MSVLARSNRSAIAEWTRTIDRPILIVCIGLIAVGLVLSLAAGPIAAERLRYEDRFFFVTRHSVFAVAAIITLIGASVFDPVQVRRLCGLMFVCAFLLMAVIYVVGHEAGGGRRWLRFAGFSLQPSEFIKPAFIVLTGWLLAQKQDYPEGPWAYVALSLFVSTLGLLLLQPDVGQSALIAGAFIAVFFVSGLPLRWLIAFVGGGAVLGGVLYLTMSHVHNRVNAFFNPDTEAYQIERALAAQASGGLMGVGPGEGEIKRSIPDGHTDFVFSIMMEEFGLVGALFLIAVFLFIVFRGLMLASRISDPYRRYAASGLFAIFGLQAAINLAVNVNLMPPKGMTLPFISYGGSSLLASALTIGLALALVRRLPVRSGRRNYV